LQYRAGLGDYLKLEMAMKKFILRTASHVTAAAIGFAGGIYALSILISPRAPSAGDVETLAADAEYVGQFRRDLAGSDLLHWGRCIVGEFIGNYLYGKTRSGTGLQALSNPEFVATEADFLAIKGRSVQLGDVKTFANFIVSVPKSVDVNRFNTVVIWCE
jgi:hypothetical protein